MRFIKSIISVLVLVPVISGAHAIKLCQLDWLNSWKNASGQLPNSRYSYSHGNFNFSQANNDFYGDGGIGIWAVTSDQGSAGVYHTVSGQSFCSSANSGTITQGSPAFDYTTSSNNMNCWCRMTSPNLGASWVFVYDYASAAYCAPNCAAGCAYCVWFGESDECIRSAVLTLP